MHVNEANRTSIPLKVLASTMIILGMLIIAAGTATYLVPAGTFKEVMRDGSTINVYQRLEQTPVPVWKIALAPLLSLTGKNGPKIIILLVFILYILFCFVLIIGVVLGGTIIHPIQDLAFPLIMLVFLAMGIGSGIISGAGGRTVIRHFIKGLGDFAPAIIIILMAFAVGYLIDSGNVMDTILFKIEQTIKGLGRYTAAVSLYFFQMLINFFVPSGSGQAALTIPILAPLGDLLGISRQTVVLAYHMGDGFSNLIWPTNPLLLIALGLAKVSYKDWFKWVLPIQLALLLVCILFLLIAVKITYV